MGIEYRPPSLEHTIKGSYGERRLRNREGVALAVNTAEGVEVWRAEGTIPEIHQQALDFSQTNPDHHVVLMSYSCGSLVVPQTPSFTNDSQVS